MKFQDKINPCLLRAEHKFKLIINLAREKLKKSNIERNSTQCRSFSTIRTKINNTRIKSNFKSFKSNKKPNSTDHLIIEIEYAHNKGFVLSSM